MRKYLGPMAAGFLICAWAGAASGGVAGSPAVAVPPATAAAPAGDAKELREELRAIRAQMAEMQKRVEALQARLGAEPPPKGAAAQAQAAPAAPAAGQPPGAAAPPPGVTPPGGVTPAGETPVTLGTALGQLMHGPVSGETMRRPGYAGLLGARPHGVIVPGLEGVPKVFIPDIGAVGDLTFRQSDLREGDPRYDPADDKFRPRDAQLIFFSPIDPYTIAQVSVDKPDREPFDLEEAFLVFNKLPWGVHLRAGQFRPLFGLLNQLDTFQLPMVNRPGALARYIGDDGLVEPGVNLNAYVPNPWEADLKADLNMVSGRNPIAFNHRQGRNFDFAYIGSLVYSRDIFGTGFLSGGASIAGGPGAGGQSYLQDAFLKLQYVRSQRQVLTWSIEGLLAERDGVGDRGVKRGLYSLLDYRFALRYHAGLLLDMADRPGVARGTEFGFSPILTYFVSDNTRLHLQYTHTTGSGPERAQDAVFLQTTFSLGNLKPLE